MILKFSWGLSLEPSVSYIKECLALAIKNYAKPDIKSFGSSKFGPFFFFTFPDIFWKRISEQTSFAHNLSRFSPNFSFVMFFIAENPFLSV